MLPAALFTPEQLNHFREVLYPAIAESLDYFGPELQVAVASLSILLIDLFIPRHLSKHLAWLALIGVTLYAMPGFVQIVSLPLPQGIGLLMLWAALILLTLGHARKTDGLIDRIIKERLCFACGRSMLDAPTDESGMGRCNRCDRQFNLAEYSSTTACLANS